MAEKKFPRIKIRLLSAILLLTLIVIVNSILHFSDVRNMNSITQEIIDHPYVVSNTVRDIEINIYAIHRTMKDVTLATNDFQFNRAIEDVNEYEKLIFKKFELLEDRFLGDFNTVTRAKKCFKKWKPIRDEVINLVQEGNIHQAAEITKGKGAIHVKLLFMKTDEMIIFSSNKAKEFNDNSINLLHKVSQKSWIVLVLTLLIGLMIFLWLFNSITKPLNQLINRVKEASKDQVSHTLPIKTTNHLQILDFAISELENRDQFLEEEVKLRTQELREARNLIRNAIDNASIGMASLNFEGVILDANRSFCKYIGYSKEELLRMKFNDFTSEYDKKASSEFIEKVLAGKIKNESLEKRYIHKSGKIIYGSVTLTVVKDNDENPIYLFGQIKDITQQIEYEKELLDYKNGLETSIGERTTELNEKSEKLSKSQKALTYLLEDVNEIGAQLKISNQKLLESNKNLESFSYSISHDLKAPLRAINGFSEIIMEDYGGQMDGEYLRLFKVITDNASRMGHLIDDLLSFSRLGRKEMKIVDVDLTKVVNDVIAESESDIKNREIDWIIKDLPNCTGDKAMLKQVYVNLISNAIKFTSREEKAIIELGYQVEDDCNVYYIKDNGVGFNMDFAGKIFEVFQRLHDINDFEGTGVGLAIVKQVIDKHNGKIWLDSEKEKGTVFYFKLNT